MLLRHVASMMGRKLTAKAIKLKTFHSISVELQSCPKALKFFSENFVAKNVENKKIYNNSKS